jgi:hypothetical protein
MGHRSGMRMVDVCDRSKPPLDQINQQYEKEEGPGKGLVLSK